MTVCLSGILSDHVKANVGDSGRYENISEYIRDLIRRDKERVDDAAFERLKGELAQSFAAPESDYHPLSEGDIFARNTLNT